jgi:hypothetical protein
LIKECIITVGGLTKTTKTTTSSSSSSKIKGGGRAVLSQDSHDEVIPLLMRLSCSASNENKILSSSSMRRKAIREKISTAL